MLCCGFNHSQHETREYIFSLIRGHYTIYIYMYIYIYVNKLNIHKDIEFLKIMDNIGYIDNYQGLL